MIFSHSGNIGDIIYSLPTIRALGGGELYLYEDRSKFTHPMTPEKAQSIRSLLIQQPYIKEVIFSEEKRPTPLNEFRSFIQPRRNLADFHLEAYKLPWSERSTPWLTVDDPIFEAPVIIARSQRYQSGQFPWAKIVQTYGDKVAMVGTKEEWLKFCEDHGHVRWIETPDLLQLARVLAGSRLFIGNQSAPESIIEGLKKDKILEVFPKSPDFCIFRRMGTVYCNESRIELPPI